MNSQSQNTTAVDRGASADRPFFKPTPRHFGWYARRRGILEHLENGTITLLDLAVHDFLCLTADYSIGVARASAEKICALCPGGFSLKSIQRSLAKLEDLNWIKRFRQHGRRGNYAIVIGKYYVRDSSRKWWSVSLEKTEDWRNVQFDHVTDPSFVEESGVTDAGTDEDTQAGSEVSPIKELRPQKPESKGKTGTFESPSTGEKPRISTLPNREKRKQGLAKSVADDRWSTFLREAECDTTEKRVAFTEVCSYIGFRIAEDDPTLGWDFVEVLIQKFKNWRGQLDSGRLLRGNFCSRVIDECRRNEFPFPLEFGELRDRLRSIEKVSERATA